MQSADQPLPQSMDVDAQHQAPSHDPAVGTRQSLGDTVHVAQQPPPLETMPPVDPVPPGDTSRAARPSYAAAVANAGRSTTHSLPKLNALTEILQRAQSALQAVVQAPQSSPLDQDPRSTLSDLAARAAPILRDLTAAHAGLAAAQALHAPSMDVDSSSVQAPQQRPLDRSSPARGAPAWSQDRCIVLDPPDDAARRCATAIAAMGAHLSTALRHALPRAPERPVEMLRRTAKGGYCAQLHSTPDSDFVNQARELTFLPIAGKQWTVSPLRQSAHALASRPADQRPRTVRRDSFIVGPVPDSLTEAQVLEAFIRDNAARFRLSESALKARLTGAHRLNRRLSRGPQAGTWVPSRSVRLQGDPALVATAVRIGTAVLDFHPVEVRPFEFAPQHCFHCGRAGHVARHCRSRCHRCDRAHPTVPCPATPSQPGPNARPPGQSSPENRRPTRTRRLSHDQPPGPSDRSGRPGTSRPRRSGVLAQW